MPFIDPAKLTAKHLLICSVFIMSLITSVWGVLLNNYAVHVVNFDGQQIGLLQSIREIPGFMAFMAIYVLLFMKEQTFAYLFLAIMCIGATLTGWFETSYWFYLSTFIMSLGFHYFETINQSLTLQWIEKKESARFMGSQLAVRSVASLLGFSSVWLIMDWFELSYNFTYTTFGVLGFVMVVVIWVIFPNLEAKHPQTKKLIVRKRYWLYYALTFMSGARRQIFTVFAAFLMVSKFDYSVGDISILFTINLVINILFAKKIGAWIGRVGERRALKFEYIGLIIIFSGYAFVTNPYMAAGLYVLDHLFFAMAIAMKTYLQKIADPQDLASTAGVSFTINHIAAVFIPVLLGMVWDYSTTWVFMCGVSFAVCSLILSFFVPPQPEEGNEVAFSLS